MGVVIWKYQSWLLRLQVITQFRNSCWKLIPWKTAHLYGFILEVPPPLPRVLLLLSRQKNVKTANAGRTVLWNESNSNKWKQNMDFFYLDPLPTNFCISDCRCFIHHSLCCQSFISIPKAYIQYNPANSNPPGEYELGLKCTKGNGNLGRVI